jgi:heat shock protein HtpX
MAWFKRIALFLAVNALVVFTISIVLNVLGVKPYLTANGLNYESLLVFCLIWGMGGAFVSLLLSKFMAKMFMGVQVIDPNTRDPEEQALVQTVYALAKQAGISKMPEVGVFDSPELNAFATGATKNSSLVAVSSGLLARMSKDEIEGVLGHEVAHIANGDMVTMTLVQGVVNAFVMFLARVLAWFASQFVEENKRGVVQVAIVLALEIGLGFLGMIVVAFFSRQREFRADAGGASLAGPPKMIAALRDLKRAYHQDVEEAVDDGRAPAFASLKISGKAGSFLRLLSTHPDLDERIRRLEELRFGKEVRLGSRQIIVSG